MSAKPEPTFEEAFAALQSAVTRMEEGEIPLDSLVEHYETGIKMLRICQKRLGDAELRIEKLREDGTLEAVQPQEASLFPES